MLKYTNTILLSIDPREDELIGFINDEFDALYDKIIMIRS